MIPPALSLPGPFDTARCRPALAAYLFAEFEQGFLNGHGPAQVGLGLLKKENRTV